MPVRNVDDIERLSLWLTYAAMNPHWAIALYTGSSVTEGLILGTYPRDLQKAPDHSGNEFWTLGNTQLQCNPIVSTTLIRKRDLIVGEKIIEYANGSSIHVHGMVGDDLEQDRLTMRRRYDAVAYLVTRTKPLNLIMNIEASRVVSPKITYIS